jgi:hypothetical protein
MKELRDVEINIKQKKKQESNYKLDALLKPYEGHPIFEINTIKKTISFAKLKPLETINFLSWQQQLKEQDILKRDGCIYVYSLNLENLRRKLNKYNDKYTNYEFIEDDKNKLSLQKNRKIKILTYESNNNTNAI